MVAIEAFTGPGAGSPWWHDTEAVLVEGESGVVLYGELVPCVKVGDEVVAGQVVGRVSRAVARLEDSARELGCLAELESALRTMARGTSAERQADTYQTALAAGASEEEALRRVTAAIARETVALAA